MNEDAFNMSVRKFLKKVGVTAQREIEQAVREAAASGKLKGRRAAREGDVHDRRGEPDVRRDRRGRDGVRGVLSGPDTWVTDRT